MLDNLTMTTPEGDTVELRRLDVDDLPEDMPEGMKELLRGLAAIRHSEREAIPHAHVGDVTFIVGDGADDATIHVSLDVCDVKVPEGKVLSATTVFDFSNLPDELKDAWLTIIRYLEMKINADPTLFTRLQAEADSTLDCELYVSLESL